MSNVQEITGHNDLIVVKIGGSTLGKTDSTMTDLVAIHQRGVKVVVVHGGGKIISDWLKRMNIQAEFVAGLRRTDSATLDVALGVLGGKINQEIVADLMLRGVRAAGISGVSSGLFQATPLNEALGYVGKVVEVNPNDVLAVVESGRIPVVAPSAFCGTVPLGEPGAILNINADTAAGHLAKAINADILIFQTDVPGVRDAAGNTIHILTRDTAHALIRNKVVTEGMIPKLEACLLALSANAKATAYIADGRQPGTLLKCLGGEEIGTVIVQ